MVMSRDSSIVGRFRISTPYNVADRLTTAFMTLASAGLLARMVDKPSSDRSDLYLSAATLIEEVAKEVSFLSVSVSSSNLA
jgi:hypothetical protein